jgi:hypothetical protein
MSVNVENFGDFSIKMASIGVWLSQKHILLILLVEIVFKVKIAKITGFWLLNIKHVFFISSIDLLLGAFF